MARKKTSPSSDIDLDELADELAEFAPAEGRSGATARDERIRAGFEEILHFVTQHGRAPKPDAQGDEAIFERLYATRLASLQQQSDCMALLADVDPDGLLQGRAPNPAALPEMSVDELAAALGEGDEDDLQNLRHVRPRAQVQVAEEIARQKPCADFADFELRFAQVQQELGAGLRQSLPFARNTRVEVGDFFILGGQLVLVSAMSEPFSAPNGEKDARLRVIYANGTESNLLLRSLQRALYDKEKPGRRVSASAAADLPLFAQTLDEGEAASGTIYVLRSLSDHPFVAAHRELVHKIGVTGGKVAQRIAGAENDPTYLLAGVEVVATYQLAGIARHKFEQLLHRFFAAAQLELTLEDRFGKAVQPKEWFLLPLAVIDAAIAAVLDGSISLLRYDPETASIQTQS